MLRSAPFWAHMANWQPAVMFRRAVAAHAALQQSCRQLRQSGAHLLHDSEAPGLLQGSLKLSL